MKFLLSLPEGDIEYSVTKHPRARHMKIAIHADQRVSVTIPGRVAYHHARTFVEEKSGWIFERLTLLRSSSSVLPHKDYRALYLKHKEEARTLVEKKLIEHNLHYHFRWQKVVIRNQRTRWGSCSKKGILNFNFKIIFLPEALADYIIVHELCHLGELNHSERFWNLVANTIPNHKELRRELRKTGHYF